MKKAIESILTPLFVSTNERDLEAYSYDASTKKEKPSMIIWPKENDQIRKILIRTFHNKTKITVRGYGTNTVGSAIGEQNIIMDMSRFNKIIRINTEKKTVTTETGVSIRELNETLKKHNLWFPIEPAWNHHTIGGLLSRNTYGVFTGLGRITDWTEDITFFDATGKIYETTNKTIIGTEGTCGIITEATLKVREPPLLNSAEVIKGDLTEILGSLESIKREENVLLADIIITNEGYELIILYENEEGKIKDEEKIRKLLKKRILTEFKNVYTHTIRGDATTTFKKLYETIKWIEKNDAKATISGLTNTIHAYFKTEKDRTEFFKQIRNTGGDVKGTEGIGTIKKEYAKKEDKDRIKHLKDQYDYHNLLNPGKILNYR